MKWKLAGITDAFKFFQRYRHYALMVRVKKGKKVSIDTFFK